MLVLCATFSRLQWRCTASHGEWHAACAAPRLARTAPESALDGPACAARAPHKLTHRLPFSGRRRSISRLSIKTGGLCDAVYAIVFWLRFLFSLFYFVFSFTKRRRRGGRALTMGNYMSKVRGRLLAAWVVWGARLRRGPGAPLSRRGVGPTLTYRGEARTTAQFINSTHLLVPSPVQRRSGRLPPRPPGPLRVLELCFGTASAMAAPLWGLHRRGVSPAGLLIPFFLFLLRAGRRVCLVCACRAGV